MNPTSSGSLWRGWCRGGGFEEFCGERGSEEGGLEDTGGCCRKIAAFYSGAGLSVDRRGAFIACSREHSSAWVTNTNSGLGISCALAATSASCWTASPNWANGTKWAPIANEGKNNPTGGTQTPAVFSGLSRCNQRRSYHQSQIPHYRSYFAACLHVHQSCQFYCYAGVLRGHYRIEPSDVTRAAPQNIADWTIAYITSHILIERRLSGAHLKARRQDLRRVTEPLALGCPVGGNAPQPRSFVSG